MPGTIDPIADEAQDPPANELPLDNTPPRPYTIVQQHVQLEIDFREKRIHGRSDIMIFPYKEIEEVYLDARQCEVDVKNITVGGCEATASYKDPCDWIQTPQEYVTSATQWGLKKRRMEPLLHHRRKEVTALDHEFKCTPLYGSIKIRLPSMDQLKRKYSDSQKSDQPDVVLTSDGNICSYKITIPFTLRKTYDGLHFVGVDVGDTRYPHVYTRHSVEPGTACSIFPCIDDPGSRNSWIVSVTCPRTVGDAFHQALATQQQFTTNSQANGKQAGQHDYSLSEEDKLLEMTVVCAGYLTGEAVSKDDETKKTMTFEIERNKAAKHIGFAVGPFEHVDLWSEFRTEEDDSKLGVSAVKVHGYCMPGRADEVKNTCAALVTAVDHMVLQFGRYPFESYKVCFVDDMIDETIPLCAFSLCSSRLLYPPEVIDTQIETTRTLVYTLASQWFGVNIVPNLKSDIWLVVGIAWYMTDYFMKSLCGNNAFRFRMKEMSDKLVEIDIKRPSLQDLGEHLYLGSFEMDFMNLKAPLVLFILDRRLSKSSGSAGISRIISRMVSKANTSGQASDEVLGSDAFRKACEKFGNTRLESFWNQWVVGSGCPRFDVFQRFNKKRLCVEMTVRQTQDIAAAKSRPIDKNDFWRDVREENHAVYAGELQGSFSGPMTIRIHEADGTPYEHIVEIREDTAKSVKFEIPYNTKYKRLKRNRRQRERVLASNQAKGNEDGQKELYYLGDVLQHPDDVEDWEFREWDEESESKMDQESYEWIRMDADFEWICEMHTNLPAYMYTSQLQQDRDVAAQQDTMLYLHRNFSRTGAHPLVSTILTRTLVDHRYYYGLRVMAAKELPRHATQDQVDWIGLKHLQKTFKHFFCYPGTSKPKPNDFRDLRQYTIQCVIPESIARVRGDDGKCPKEARRFILDLLQSNNNEGNMYSDQLYICKLLKALSMCLIPDESKAKPKMAMSLSFGDGDEDEMMEDAPDREPEQFRDLALLEIERYRNMDEYFPSYQNCYTVAALDAQCRLMKAKVIPLDGLVFVQYLQDKTIDLVRIKACDCLVELDCLKLPKFIELFLNLVSKDPSPFVRDRLFKALCRGLASIAIGENLDAEKEARKQQPAKDGLDLVVEHDNVIMEARQKLKTRREDLTAALAALKEETQDDEDLQKAIWLALESPILTVAERINILELCSVLVEEDQMLLMRFKYPTFWTVEMGERVKNRRCVVKFKRHVRTKSRKTYAIQAPPPPQPTPVSASRSEPTRKITLNLNKGNSVNVKPPVISQSPTVSSPQGITVVPPRTNDVVVAQPKPPQPPKPTIQASKQAAAPAKPTVTVGTPRASTPAVSQEKPTVKNGVSQPQHRDSISVQAPVRPSIELPTVKAASPAPIPKVNGNGIVGSHPALSKVARPLKRASTETSEGRPTKMVKLNTSKIRPALARMRKQPRRKLVTVKFKRFGELKSNKGSKKEKERAGSEIRAAPKNQPQPSRMPTPKARAPTPPPISKDGQGPSSSPPLASTPTSSSQTLGQSQHSSGGSASGGKPDRKPLPNMRKPLPSAHAPHPIHSSPSKSAKSTSPPAPAPPPAVAPAPAPAPSKAPTKFKIKLKPSQSQ
ncbi:hypothetical protein F5Y15DRAFT_371044 [Xylariaceae sp. FL0016]|nr:hypothetical protein F5Y15DRAFT_371044 [Xylariaceae sp. FL0016]